MRLRPFTVLAACALLLGACEKPDASFQTSPSAEALIGTATGNVAFAPPEQPPGTVASPAGWDHRFEAIFFDELEDGSPSIRVVLQEQTKRGAGFELWLATREGTLVRWTGGSTDIYSGTVCFQLKLKDGDEALVLPSGVPITATIAYRDVERGVIASQSLPVRGTVPKLSGSAPGPESKVFKSLLGCPRGS